MQKVKVTHRNQSILCRRCKKQLGDVAEHAFYTHLRGGRRNHYCANCGKEVENCRCTP